MSIKVYRLKHKPTGLYYTPSKGSGNLSKTGKSYVNRKPSIDWALTLRIKITSWKDKPNNHHKIICDYFNIDWGNGIIDRYFKTNVSDWEIEELK